MGGEVRAAGAPGGGTLMTVTLPAAAASPSRRDPLPDGGLLAGRSLLVVGAHQATRRALRRRAESWGMTVTGTDSPETARAWVAAGRGFDLALVDAELLPALRPGLGGLPVVVTAPVGGLLDGGALDGGPRDGGPRDDGPGAGAVVVSRPVKAAPAYRALVTALSAAPADGPRPPDVPDRAPLRVLVADDHPVNQRLVLLMLAAQGLQADVVSDGAEAVTAVLRRRYDVVLMDVQMPELDGPGATRSIRAELGAGGPWIVAVTADAQPATRDACRAAGMDDFLTKPLVAEDLSRALSRAREHRRPASSGEVVLDPAALGELRNLLGGDPAQLSGLVADFLADAPDLVGTLRSAVAGGDHETALRAAHTLKGLGDTFGATAMARLCERAEAGGEGADLVHLVDLVALEHERVAAALRHLA